MKSRKLSTGDVVLLILTVSSIVFIFMLDPIGQDPSYHYFADQREVFGVFNFLNVITNLPFVIIGLIGLIDLAKGRSRSTYIAGLTLVVGVIGIGFGSGWYHYNPTNGSLVWDRIPMTITFMSYFSIIVTRYVNEKLGKLMLLPMLALGVFSVCYWYVTEQNGHGDLRLYAWVQFYPMLCIPLILFLYPASKTIKLKIASVIGVYAIAKAAERADDSIFQFYHIISGHSLKHLLASASVWLILLTLRDSVMQKEEVERFATTSR